MRTCFKNFKKYHISGKNQLVSYVLLNNFLTPLVALAKLQDKSPYHLLFESVIKGETKGRYSIIALMPDKIWRCKNGVAQVNENILQNVKLDEENFTEITPLDVAGGNHANSNNDGNIKHKFSNNNGGGNHNHAISIADDVKNNLKGDGGVFASLKEFLQSSLCVSDEDLPSAAYGVFGYMGYDMFQYIESSLKPYFNKPDETEIPQALYYRPQIILIFDNIYDKLTIIAPSYYQNNQTAEAAFASASNRIDEVVNILTTNNKEYCYFEEPVMPQESTSSKIQDSQNHAENIYDFKSKTSYEDYIEKINLAKEHIATGDIFQIVPSRRLIAKFPDHPLDFYKSLRCLNPSPYLFYFNYGYDVDNPLSFTLSGSSPEIMVNLKEDGRLKIRPLAGTRKRGKTEQQDKELEQELLADEKELAEHLMLLDLGRNDIGRVANFGSVRVTEQMKVERYSHVMHIVSDIEGMLKQGMDEVDVLIAAFPAGTVSGAPKIKAMEIIAKLEDFSRSFYAGTMGYLTAGKGLDTCIMLRTCLIKNGHIIAQAGGGIVADSDPDLEYQETQNKANAIIKAVKNIARHKITGHK